MALHWNAFNEASDHFFLLQVEWKVYFHYFRSFGWFLAALTLLSNVAFQGFSVASSMWLSIWSDDSGTGINETISDNKRDKYLEVYGALGMGQGMLKIFY